MIAWLRHQPLVIQHNQSVLVHAGIPHLWSVDKALSLSREVEAVLQSDKAPEFFAHMYGNTPAVWSDNLLGMDRLRVITNYLTRMRVCSTDGVLQLDFKGAPQDSPAGYLPWFLHYSDTLDSPRHFYFGHWANLPSKTYRTRFHAMDSGCVWGKQLTVIREEDGARIACDCKEG